MNTRKVRILFCVSADADNVNAQSLNECETALRLDPQLFASTLLVWRKPDPRLVGRASIRFVQVPPRLGSVVIAAQMVWGRHDLIFYPPYDRAMTLYRVLRRWGRHKKIIMTVEGTAQQVKAIPLPRQTQYLSVLRDADARYAISPYIADSMRQEFGFELSVVPIGVDTRLFAPCERADHKPPLKVLCVGSIQPRKQVHLILDLAGQIDRGQAEFHVVGDVIGSPDYRAQLLQRKQAEKLDHVFFHGKQDQTAVKVWMQQADIFVLPSRLEGTPKVLFEAAATGLPCIVFDDYHTPSVVDGNTGFQVETFDQMLDCLKLLIENRELRLKMGRAGTEHVKPFDWDLVVRQWEQIFVQAACNRPGCPSNNKSGSSV